MLPPPVEAALARADAAGFEMSCDPGVGQLLAVLAATVNPHGRVLELGTGCGVGLAWIVHGLESRADVAVVSIESSHEVAKAARAARFPEYVSIIEGDAVSLLPTLGEFDLVFADAQGGKWERLDLTIGAVRFGGMLIVDDMTPARWGNDEHQTKTTEVKERLLTDPSLTSVELAYASGVILCARNPAASELPPCTC
jgi:demethylmenaquinone methyltransferase/2-methoxy-6-polyprenyl-1,4-benzoquinol methylase